MTTPTHPGGWVAHKNESPVGYLPNLVVEFDHLFLSTENTHKRGSAIL